MVDYTKYKMWIRSTVIRFAVLMRCLPFNINILEMYLDGYEISHNHKLRYDSLSMVRTIDKDALTVA